MRINSATQQLIDDFIEQHQLGEQFQQVALNWFIPLAERVFAHQSCASKGFFVGINGCQGSGKTTLTHFLHQYLAQVKGLSVASMSLDDFYLSRRERATLAEKAHPLLFTRGVPGTHNTQRIAEVLTALRDHQPTTLPKFNKATDDPYPPSAWPKIEAKVEVVLFEGWCWGVTAELPAALNTPINDLEQYQDAEGTWRRYVNQQITQHYVPLYQHMHFWIQLKAPSFDCVYQWRLQQEQQLIQSLKHASGDALKASKGLMQPQQIATFIQYYQRLTEHALCSLAATCDVVMALDENRNISACKGLT